MGVQKEYEFWSQNCFKSWLSLLLAWIPWACHWTFLVQFYCVPFDCHSSSLSGLFWNVNEGYLAWLCVHVFTASDSLWSHETVACQAPLSMEFSRQECWSGLPFPSPGNLTNPAIETASLASPALVGGFLTTAPPGKPYLQGIQGNATKFQGLS